MKTVLLTSLLFLADKLITKENLLMVLRFASKAAKKTDTPIDDEIVAKLKEAIKGDEQWQ